jgi:hypothetical protein
VLRDIRAPYSHVELKPVFVAQHDAGHAHDRDVQLHLALGEKEEPVGIVDRFDRAMYGWPPIIGPTA